MTQGLSGSLGEVGEFGLVKALTSRFAQSADVVVGPGDDAAVLRVAGDVVASVDLLVQNRHFRLEWSSAADIGHKAAAENLSDINAMGGRPTALLVGLGAPADLDADWALEFADGLAAEADKVGASIIGGDLTQADQVLISVTALGVCEHGVVRRSGAQPGDVVALAGRQGWAGAGFLVLGRGFRSPRAVVDAHRRPEPPYEAGPQAARLGATAMIDISDGFLQDLGHLGESSGVHIDVRSDALDVPEPLQAVGAAMGVDPVSFVLTGGDDYGLLATFPPDVDLPSEWRLVGLVGELVGDDSAVVTVDGEVYEPPSGQAGHQHFRD
jgi:thiamine-monophosphate kinase